jgi:hypothetical protein
MSESTPEPPPAGTPSPQPVGDLDTTYGTGSADAGPAQDVPTDTILQPPAGQP